MRAMCAVRYATGIPAAVTSSTPSGIRQRLSFRTASHSLSAPSSKTPYGPVNITREPTGKSVPPPSSTTPAPSLPRTSGAFRWWGNLPERMVWSSGVTPAAVMRTSTLPSALRGRGASTSFRPPYPVNDSARMVLIIAELMVFSFSCLGEKRPLTLPRFKPSGLKKSVKWTAHQELLLHLLRLVGEPLSLSRAAISGAAVTALHLCEAAIHKQLRSRDVTAVVGSEKHHGLGDLIGRTDPAERNNVGSGLQALLACFRGMPWGRVGNPWADHVHANVAIFQVRCPCPGERTHGGFGGVINAPLRYPFTGANGRIQDDRGANR